MAWDAAWLRLAWEVGLTLIMAALAIGQWLLARDQIGRDKLAAMQQELTARLTRLEAGLSHAPSSARCTAAAERLTRLEEMVRAAPAHTDLADLYAALNPLRESVAGLRADLVNMGEAMRGMRRGIETLTESLLRRDEATR